MTDTVSSHSGPMDSVGLVRPGCGMGVGRVPVRGTKAGIVAFLTLGLLTVSTMGGLAQSDAAAPESLIAQPIELPAEVPEEIESGTFETPLGPARWVHLSGRTMAFADDAPAGRTLPAAHTLIPWEDGVAAMGFFGLWTTSDGVDWAIVPLPGDLGGPFQRRVLKHVDGTYVLVYEDPLRVWTAEDLDGDWRELDVSALEAAAPAAGWKGRHVHMSGHARLTAGPVALEDGHIVFSVSQEYRLPTPVLGLPLKETKRMRRLGDDRYALCGSGSCSDGGSKAKWTVRFEETDAGLSVVNDKTGKRLGRIDGADLSELYEGATGLKVASFEIDGDTVVPIDAPWPALDLIDPDYMPGGAMVFAPGGSTPVFRSWLSRRGLRPGDPGVPAVARVLPLANAEHTSLTVSEHPDRLSAVLWADLGRTTYRVLGTWESTDGATWREGPQVLSDKARPGYTGSAWYAKGVYSRGLPNGKHWLHIGGEWVSIDELGFPSKIDPALMAGLGNVTVFTSDPLRDVVDVWVLTHPRSTDDVAVQEEWTDATAPVRSDLLPGVDLVTEEVEPGVYRVLSDGVRDLSRPADAPRYLGGILDGNIVTGLDGSVWWFGLDGFLRIGEEGLHPWPEELGESFQPGLADIEVAADGTAWLAYTIYGTGTGLPSGISSYDGRMWTSHWQGAGNESAYGVDVQQDGTVWAAWASFVEPEFDENDRPLDPDASKGTLTVARLDADGWEVLPGTLEPWSPWPSHNLAVAEGGASEVWLSDRVNGRLHRHDAEGWVDQGTPDVGGVGRVAVGPDGTVWVRLNAQCNSRLPCTNPSDILARFDGHDWAVFGPDDGIPLMGDHYQGFEGFFAVAPDRSIWFNPRRAWESTETECDGVARFDGKMLRRYLPDHCISAMDVAPDGSVWLQGGEFSGDWDRPADPIHTYVITPEAVATAE